MPQFDAAYYHRFYTAPRSRVQGPKEVARLATAVTSIVEATHGPIASVLEIGAGTGLWRAWFAKKRPKALYRSTELSAYAAREYGHERRDITRWRAKSRYDLVVCQGVLPYLSDAEVTRALANLAAMTGSYLYLEAVTARDLASVADNSVTDPGMRHRTGEWYRERLARHFQQVGFGLWVRRGADVRLWELEAAAE
jgi:predicted TPR repeat methyltransferase